MLPRIGITAGDAAGVGPEILRAALESQQFVDRADLLVIGDCPDCSPGNPTPQTAGAALAAMEEAVRLANSGEIDAIVTGPIHKARMAEIGFTFPGQTEFFATRTATTNYAMLLTGGSITVALVTTHVPLGKVPGLLTTSAIVRAGKLLEQYLRRRGKAAPRIAVAGLNPHAGESGKMGRDEIEVITPAVAKLNESLLSSEQGRSDFAGPLPADTLFFHLANGKWDAALCMYHDQGLIPLKLHAFYSGVNVTLGLPFPRTSPDHGTAFEIAGKGIARPDSMIAAIKLAAELAQKETS